MILLGQHGQRQDYQVGLEHIEYAARTCDENAPQGAYVSTPLSVPDFELVLTRLLGVWDAPRS